MCHEGRNTKSSIEWMQRRIELKCRVIGGRGDSLRGCRGEGLTCRAMLGIFSTICSLWMLEFWTSRGRLVRWGGAVCARCHDCGCAPNPSLADPPVGSTQCMKGGRTVKYTTVEVVLESIGTVLAFSWRLEQMPEGQWVRCRGQAVEASV